MAAAHGRGEYRAHRAQDVPPECRVMSRVMKWRFTVHVRGLPQAIRLNQLVDAFERYGVVEAAHIQTHYSFVEFATYGGMCRALADSGRVSMRGVRLAISPLRKKTTVDVREAPEKPEDHSRITIFASGRNSMTAAANVAEALLDNLSFLNGADVNVFSTPTTYSNETVADNLNVPGGPAVVLFIGQGDLSPQTARVMTLYRGSLGAIYLGPVPWSLLALQLGSHLQQLDAISTMLAVATPDGTIEQDPVPQVEQDASFTTQLSGLLSALDQQQVASTAACDASSSPTTPEMEATLEMMTDTSSFFG